MAAAAVAATVNPPNANNKSSLAFRPAFVDDDAQANESSLTEYGRSISNQIEAMQKQRESWRDFLRELYEADVIQDNRARELKRQVLIGEAEALANPTFHRWMRGREQFGVGREKIDAWFNDEALQRKTPYSAVVPCPRNLSDEGWKMVEETVADLHNGASFSLEWWPLMQHTVVDAAAVPSRRTEEHRAFQMRSSADVRKQVESSSLLAAALVETPCFLFGDEFSTSKLSPATGSTPLVAFVVRGTLIAAEPYFAASPVRFPSGLAPPLQRQASAMATSANCAALRMLQDWIEALTRESLAERSFAACVMMHPVPTPTAANNGVEFSLLNIAPLDAVDSQSFAWSDLVGLIVQVQNKRESAINSMNTASSTNTSDAEDGESESLDQDRKKAQAAIAVVQALEAQKADVVFRGQWIVHYTASVASPSPAAAIAPRAASSSPAVSSATTTSTATTAVAPAGGSYFGSSLVVGAAAVACIASAAIGITLGMKMSTKK